MSSAEPELRADRDDGERRAREPGAVEHVAGPAGAALDLRQPEPGVERRDDEDEPVGADQRGRDGDARRGRGARPRTRRAPRPRRQARPARAPGARATSRARRARRGRASPATGQSVTAGLSGGGGIADPRGKTPASAPSPITSPIQSQTPSRIRKRPPGARQRQPPPPAAGEEVDRADEKRDERDDEDELDRPAADDPAPEVDVPRRSPRELDAAVERREDRLGGPAEADEPGPIEARRACRVAAPAPSSPAVVSRIAEISRPRNGACSP